MVTEKREQIPVLIARDFIPPFGFENAGVHTSEVFENLGGV